MKHLFFVFSLFLLCLAACGDDELNEDGASSSLSSAGSSSQSLSAQKPASSSSAPASSVSAAASLSSVGAATALDFNYRVGALEKMSAGESLPEPVRIGAAETNWHGDEYTVTARYRAAPEFSEVLALDANSDVVWPGAVIQGESVFSGDYVPFAGKRAPLTFSISLENIQGKRFAAVESPRLSAIRQAVGDILAQNLAGSTPARVSFSIEEVHDEGQLALAVGAGAGNGNNMIKAQFDFNNSANRSRILVKFIQIYYTLDIDLPERPSDLFTHDADVGSMCAGLGAISPIYVSSISYGRAAFFSFESSSDIESLKAAVNVSLQALLGGVEGEISLTHKTILNNSKIAATLIGGNGATAVNAVRGFDGLRLHLLAGGNYDKNSPAAAISYKMRYLSDNTTVRFVLTGEYEAVDTFRACDWYAVRDLRLACGAEDGSGKSAKFYGECSVSMKTNGVRVQGYKNGAAADELVWLATSMVAAAYNLKPGEWKSLQTERLFKVRRADLGTAVLRVSGEVSKDGLLWGTSLGERELSLTLSEIPDGMIWLPLFQDGDTKARIGFSLTRLDP